MNIEEIKNKILQLAIEGKLVKQNPNDTPASVLLEEIKSEKERLIKEKKIKKEKALPDITEEEKRFELPEGWEWCRLGVMANKITDGTHHSPKTFEKGAYMYVTAKDIEDNGVNTKFVTYISEEVHTPIYNRCNVEYGDILITKDGKIGTVSVNQIKEPFSLLSSVGLIKTNKKYLDNWYITYAIRSPFIQSDIKSITKGSAIRRITITTINTLIIPLPPLEEQKRIVHKVEELFAIAHELNENKEEILKDIANTRNKVLQLAVQGKLVEQCKEDRPARELLEEIKAEKEKLIKEKVIKKEKALPEIGEEEKSFELPEGWAWCRLGSISNFLGGYAFKSSKYVKNSKNQIIRLGNIKNENIILNEKQVFIDDEYAKFSSAYKIKLNDILVTMTGTKGKRDYFYTSIVEVEHLKDISLYLNQRVGCIRTNDYILSKYLNYILKSNIILNNIFEFETGSANQGNLGAEAIKNLIIPLPPLEEQKRIVDKVDEVMGYLDELEKVILFGDII